MNYLATITSKRQFTIPSNLFKIVNYKPQQRLLINVVDADAGLITIKPMSQLVEDMAGSVPVTSEYKNLSLNKMVEKAKDDYYKNTI
ncbi:hypothetical protein A2130_00810 [Candidatus Woesebacteria bacterium GWC2_33_12]|uniref:SpoVT-AbrB domain-containing protein n=1 Tax=Candidatus Woesebacteria bacterium GW2011_GWB1_33_22 TaxID=1618566 RepID=A0A0G0C295_9BACT|nr:MAG: hypothetical protein UR29_C0002G0055 [Candidatus Woesebacteria bacterium GW2011_GWC2_33_12]KKP42527.1 MAG: hypothetical protein UR33_C0002G0103 [Candidatus Woesebacteria bacterium GW2011_GWA2_33_20]KKP45270.1 MAG: hypothetical protein UR35_C0002G0103 [Candidatus Woesebacteria bacterium GW2011_GWB1_33_22]KKP47098.1 MAG: hypothetical protein UR37_C0002G0010 [Microgenomates group bacterium GW2011_GWC1_33_28]KKP50940.1 MAG: hypothetical protein UR41_C0002G0104 [Candidatus Woesebacteria bact